MKPHIELHLTDRDVRPGDWVVGWVDGRDLRRGRYISVELNTVEVTDQGHSTVTTTRVVRLYVLDASAQVYPFTLQLPEDALPGFEFPHGRTHWVVTARTPRPLRRAESDGVYLPVKPRARELDDRAEDAPPATAGAVREEESKGDSERTVEGVPAVPERLPRWTIPSALVASGLWILGSLLTRALGEPRPLDFLGTVTSLVALALLATVVDHPPLDRLARRVPRWCFAVTMAAIAVCLCYAAAVRDVFYLATPGLALLLGALAVVWPRRGT